MKEESSKLRPIDIFMWTAVFCIVAFTAYKVGRIIYWGKISQDWPTTEGIVYESYKTTWRRGGAHATIRYRYWINGTDYESDRVSFYDLNKIQWLDKYPAWADVIVYVDPELHSRSVLEPGANLSTAISMELSTIGLGVSIILLFLVTGYGRKWSFSKK